jgi:hypothetical protein
VSLPDRVSIHDCKGVAKRAHAKRPATESDSVRVRYCDTLSTKGAANRPRFDAPMLSAKSAGTPGFIEVQVDQSPLAIQNIENAG